MLTQSSYIFKAILTERHRETALQFSSFIRPRSLLTSNHPALYVLIRCIPVDKMPSEQTAGRGNRPSQCCGPQLTELTVHYRWFICRN
jgi:hypothetical protein